MKLNYIAGLDIGNGYVKGLIDSVDGGNLDAVDMPSIVVQMARPNQVPTPDEEAPAVVAQTSPDFFNNLDCSMTSPMIQDTLRRITGTRALTAKGAIDEFDLVGKRSKSEQVLSKALVLSIIAAKAAKDAITATGQVPTERLDVKVTAALALPIGEYHHHRTSYAAAFTGDRSRGSTVGHLVTINNFDTPISVRIVFDDVAILAEGASAQYAITAGGLDLMEGLLADVRARGMELPGITAADVLAATSTIGVDVGEGTVNFPVFTGGEFNVDASRTLSKGYGVVLEHAIVAMDDANFAHGFSSRKQLAEYLQRGPSPLKRSHYAKVTQFVEQEMSFFVTELAETFAAVLADVGALTDVAYVYGGGSGPLREQLHDMLLAKASEMNSADSFPVMYLDSAYSRNLNREGLMIAASTVAKGRTKKKTAAARA